MKSPLKLLTLVSALALLPLSGAAAPEAFTISVDCSKNQTITSAIEKGNYSKPLLIRIKGTCRESVSITRDHVTLEGEPGIGATIEAPDTSSDVVDISGNDVTLDNLTLVGGNNGIRNRQARVTVENCVIQDSAGDGVRSMVGDNLTLAGSTIQRAAGNGVSIGRHGAGVISNSQILESMGSGIYAVRNASISARGNTIRGNHANGIFLDGASYGDFSANEVGENQQHGMLIQGGSTAYINDSTISNNQWDGVHVYLGSTLNLSGNQVTENQASGVVGNAHSTVQIVTSQINGNTGDGIVMMLGSKLILEGDKTRVHDNENFALWCGDEESSVNNLELLDWTGEVHCTGF